MKVLVVTGTQAKKVVEANVGESGVKAKVVSLPVQVAALMTTKLVVRELTKMDVEGFDLILLPGMMTGDTGEVWKAVGIPTFKGPRHAADLPLILESLSSLSLSTSKPACELVQDSVRKRALQELDSVGREASQLAAGGVGFFTGRGGRVAWTHRGYPPIIVAEIVNSSSLADEAIQRRAKYYSGCGAGIIDIGMEAGGGHENDARRAVNAVAKVVPNPISIDSNDAGEIEAAVDAGVDLILSINSENMDEVSKFASGIPVVVTPAGRGGEIPPDHVKRVSQLEMNIRHAKSLGFKHVVADPVLEPPQGSNLLESILTYVEFGGRNPEVPTLFGVGNVTELVDVDSVGLNFLLAHLGWQLGVSLIFTTEASDKTHGSVMELSTALRMVTLAQRRSSPPKDLGLDLLLLKEKRRKDEVFDVEAERAATTLKPLAGRVFIHGPKGYFRIRLDRQSREIVALHYTHGGKKPDFVVRGSEPAEIYEPIIDGGLVSSLSQAAYLGCELENARVALLTGKSYVQDVVKPFS